MLANLLLAVALLSPDDAACANPVMASAAGPLPKLIHKRGPAYPKKARERGIAGSVVLRALVCRDGRVHDVTVEYGIPWSNGVLEEEAERTVRTWMYRPAVKEGQPVAVYIPARGPVSTLDDEPSWPAAKVKLNVENTTLDRALALLESVGLKIDYVGSAPPVDNKWGGWTVHEILGQLADDYALHLELLAPRHLRVTALPAHDEAGVVPPVLESKVPLERPPDAPKDAHGTIGLNVAVRTDGTVGGVAVVRRSGNPSVSNAALEAVRQWRYRPATREGRPLAVYVPAEIEF